MKTMKALVVLCCIMITNTVAHAQTTAVKDVPMSKGMIITLSLMPLIMFFLFFILVIIGTDWRKLLHNILMDKTAKPLGHSLKPQLDDSGKHIVLDGVPQFAQVDEYPKSMSRLVLLLTSFSAIFMALSMVSTAIYGYLSGEVAPDFNGVAQIALSLGIGVVPYVVNTLKGGTGTSNAPTQQYSSAPQALQQNYTTQSSPVSSSADASKL